MAVLVHNCTDCGHRQDWHGQGSYARCRCCGRSRGTITDLSLESEPVQWETYSHPGGHPEPLFEPGVTRDSGHANITKVCGCERCREIYAEQVRP